MLDWARKELELIEAKCSDNEVALEMQKLITKDILEIIEVFDKQGHTNNTGPYSIRILQKLLNWVPLTCLTGEDEEWTFSYEHEGDIYEMNKRCFRVFRKNCDNSTAYNNYGKVFSEDNGKTYYRSRESVVPVTFPYLVPMYPKKVLVEEISNDEEETNER